MYSTNFICYFGLFEYASAHRIQWQDSQPNDSGHLVVEVEVVNDGGREPFASSIPYFVLSPFR